MALVILVVSMTKASLNLMAKDNRLEVLKKNEINFVTNFGNGETFAGSYKFPNAGMTSDNMLYGFKRIRDYMWLTFSSGYHKAELAILMADKKMVEFEMLSQKGMANKAFEAGNESIEKLEYANGLLNEFHSTDETAKKLRQQIFVAGLAYKETASGVEKEHTLNRQEYSKLITRINDFIKEQEKNKYTWNF